MPCTLRGRASRRTGRQQGRSVTRPILEAASLREGRAAAEQVFAGHWLHAVGPGQDGQTVAIEPPGPVSVP